MKLLSIPLILALAACAGKPQIIEVPVPVKMAPPPVLVRPSLPIATLPRDATPGEQVDAWAVTVEVLQNYIAEIETILEGYR